MNFLARLAAQKSWGLLIVRLAVGSIFLVHGISKWSVWSPEGASQVPPDMLTIMKILSIAEPLGGAALILGFLTQFAAIGLAVIMVGALWFKIKVWNIPFFAQNTTGWEFDFLLLATNLLILFSGSGKIALDRLIFRR